MRRPDIQAPYHATADGPRFRPSAAGWNHPRQQPVGAAPPLAPTTQRLVSRFFGEASNSELRQLPSSHAHGNLLNCSHGSMSKRLHRHNG